jgi:Flp pilus assembly protein TadG
MISRLLRGRGDRERGAQAVEFALLSLPLLYILYGAISFGFTINAQITATQLARDAARTAAICGTAANCQTTTQTEITNNTPSGFTVVSSSITTCTSPTADASVTITTRPPLYFLPFLTSGTSIQGKAVTPCGG